MRPNLKVLLLPFLLLPVSDAAQQQFPPGPAIDAEVAHIVARTHAKGVAVATIDHGKVAYIHAYGIRNANGDPSLAIP